MSGLVEISKVLEIIASYCPDDDGTCSKADRDLREMLDEIENMDDVDAVSVVRCKDCKHYRSVLGFVDKYCHAAEWYKWHQYPDDFCSRGEKAEES